MRSQSAAIAVQGAPTREASKALLAQALAARELGTDLIVTVPAPVAAPDALLRAFPDEASVLWDPPDPPDSAACSGLGVAATLPPSAVAVERFFRLTRRVASERSPKPRVFGGSSFALGAASEPPWEAFGDGFLVLPRWSYLVSNEGWLSLALGSSERVVAAEILEVFDAIWRSLERPLRVVPATARARRVRQSDRDDWFERVEAIRRKIREGVFRKVVAARHCVVELGERADSLDVLERLEERFHGCTRFALWREDATFLGATPELLVSRRGASVRSEALAGSTARGDAARMMASKKEQEEHQLVVSAVLAALEPFCEALQSAPEPSVRELPNVLHMQTPVHGHLRDDTHVLDLAQALHPTPAVGGVPGHEAIAWIVERETLPRGWYSAPVGWVDAAGDGEFFVALRSGLMRGGRAWVYAGAGIMADSDPNAEYEETELKMEALLGALDGDAG